MSTVITKDLSRLGRNYLKTGELIEIIFPEYDVRYIAINDGVDTAREDNEFTPLRNWFNEFYTRDTSKKIRAVKQAKAQRGERVNGEVPYGYIADPNDRNHLIPAPETAHIVGLLTKQRKKDSGKTAYKKGRLDLASSHTLYHPFQVQGRDGKEAVVLRCLKPSS